MTRVRGIVVKLRTSDFKNAGTDDHIYVGVVGTGGGREFPLDLKGTQDFERDSYFEYLLGEVWDGTAALDPRKPTNSKPNGRNDPKQFRIELEDVQYVYIRKQSHHLHNSPENDDAYKLEEVEVTIYGSSPSSRVFSCSDNLWFGDEYGQQAWIPEDSRPTSIPLLVGSVAYLRRFQ